MRAFQEQKKDGCEHVYERSDLERVALSGEHKQGCDQRA
jgi:hypothetical protein